jgi:hypothetical protein
MNSVLPLRFIKEVCKFNEFNNSVTESNVVDFFENKINFSQLIASSNFKGDTVLLEKKLYATFLNNIIFYLKEEIDKLLHDGQNELPYITYLKYYKLITATYNTYKSVLYLRPQTLYEEEEVLFNNINSLIPNHSYHSYKFIYNQSFSDCHIVLNKSIEIINTIDFDKLTPESQISLINTKKRYTNLLIKNFDNQLAFYTSIEKQDKINDFLINMSSFHNILNFSSISYHINNKLIELKSSFNKETLKFEKKSELINENTIKTTISFPVQTTNGKSIYKDIYLYLEKFIKPRNIKFSLLYEKSANDIEYYILFEAINQNYFSIIIHCDKKFSPIFSKFIFNKIEELGNLFFDIHTNDINQKNSSFIKFAKNLMKEERELYLNYIIENNSNKSNEIRTKSKI